MASFCPALVAPPAAAPDNSVDVRARLLMDETTITPTVPLLTGVEAALAWCRSAESRLCWPGAQHTWGGGDAMFYEVTMKAPGAEAAEMLVEEHLREIRRLNEDEVAFDSHCEWRWPTGDIGTVLTSYRFKTADPNTLEFVMRYLPPGTAVGARINRRRFDPAMRKVVNRYTTDLTSRIHLPVVSDQS
jgi:hypothetical protein